MKQTAPRKSRKNPETTKKKLPKPRFETVTFQKNEIVEITPDMIIGDVVLAYPETLPILQAMGIHCIGCYASTFESIQEGVVRHGLDPQKVCAKLNRTILETHQK